ncbi:MAG: DUF1679 domain-containing protein [Aureispira sp.]|nr:DUF1679 domain-containing protein [Aureispira sp.]
MNPNFRDYLLKATQSSGCKELEIIQSLWSGYGKISRYQLEHSPLKTVVVKFISLNQSNKHPRGWNTELSHNRKVKSYEIETYWYEKWNQLCTDNCSVPQFIGSFSEGKDQWIILEDLNAKYPLRKHQLDFSEVKVCLKWLANFHATFLNKEPIGLWPIGTYWHLATRPDEFEKIEHQELKSKAELIDQLLNECKYQTIVHGDAKLANFCFSENGKNVAAVDFQYVGGGCGMKDVAYFLGSVLSSSECELYQHELLDFYFLELKKGLESSTLNIDFKDLELEWRQMYPLACTDFTRFLLGWMPSHQKINDYNLKLMNSVLSSL